MSILYPVATTIFKLDTFAKGVIWFIYLALQEQREGETELSVHPIYPNYLSAEKYQTNCIAFFHFPVSNNVIPKCSV